MSIPCITRATARFVISVNERPRASLFNVTDTRPEDYTPVFGNLEALLEAT